MFRVNVQGTVLCLTADGLFDLLEDIRSHMRNATIVRFSRGYVVDSLGHDSVVVNVSEVAL